MAEGRSGATIMSCLEEEHYKTPLTLRYLPRASPAFAASPFFT